MNAPLRVLLLEDSSTDAKLTLRAVREGFPDCSALRIASEPELRRALREGSWDIVLSDWSMPGFSAYEALAIVAQSGLDLPVVLVSGTIGEETAAEAMRLGARDFVVKDRIARLVPAIERELRARASRAARGVAELALRRSEARFARLYESGIIAIASADTEGVILEANDAYLALIGARRDEIRAGTLRWTDVLDPSALAPDTALSRDLVATGKAERVELTLTRRDGSQAHVLAGIAMLDEREGISFMLDVTERKRAEAELRQREAELRQVQKTEAIGRLAGGVAHDFNNLLSVVLSCAELALDNPDLDAATRDALLEIRGAGERGAALTRQLLAVGRRQVLRPQALDLGEVVTSTRSLLLRLLREDVQLVTELGGPLPRARLDVGQLGQVLLNLVVNARDAMPEGGTIRVRTGTITLDETSRADFLGAATGLHVLLEVADDGVGMAPEVLARACEPFFTTKGPERGTGLGLSTVLGIVQQSGGAMAIHSTPGHGTCVRVVFPALREDEATEADAVSTPAARPRGGETLLLVEDDDTVRALARVILERQGYTVVAVPDGVQAIERFDAEPDRFALVVTDVLMPQMSGTELVRRLRERRPQLPVLFMSGHADDTTLQRGLDPNAAFLPKPITPGPLSRKVREILDAAATPRA
ncbi:MAG: response regulator [Nannocystaceae bacterium]|nr:response regulator [Nannocystaceae bacterium]